MDYIFEKTKIDILAWSIEDSVSLYFISSFVKKKYNSNNSSFIKRKSLENIKNLLEEKLVIAGDLTKDNEFVSWKMSIDEILQKIERDWNNLGRDLYMYELVWFEITEKGKKEFEYLNSLPELRDED